MKRKANPPADAREGGQLPHAAVASGGELGQEGEEGASSEEKNHL